MADRTGLIERAAALLRDEARVPEPPGAASPDVPGTPSAASLPPLSRSVTLDRAHLAQSGIIMPWATTARVVEEFRIIKRNIMFPWQTLAPLQSKNRPPRVVMVTSARPREGKTFAAINLALAFAAEENHVAVLVDVDPVRADATRMSGAPREPGLTEVLAGERPLHDVLVQTDLPDLIILPPGAHAPHVSELLTARGPSLFAEIARRYPDCVIILDTPPCLASSDPAALAPIVGQIVFVIEARHTQKAEIEAALSLLSGCGQISFLLNKAPADSSEHFGSYSDYYRPGETAAKAAED